MGNFFPFFLSLSPTHMCVVSLGTKKAPTWKLQQQFNERLFKIKTHLASKPCIELILHGLQLVQWVI